MNDCLYSIIDIETTGAQKQGHKITEISVINFNGKEITETFTSLINPERNIPYAITRLTGISNEMVANAPKFFQVAKKIVEMTEGRVFVAHNVFFDYNFIKAEFNELGFSYKRNTMCTVKNARRFLPDYKSYSLGKLCRDLSIPLENHHRAYADARATVEILKLILEKTDKPVFSEKKLVLPNQLAREEYESLPESPGIYYFYDGQGELLYVGKAKNIKKRVSSHFRPDMKRRKDLELKNQIAHIDHKLLGCEIAALLFECHEIKRLKPPFNRSLNRVRFPYAVVLKDNGEGLLELKVSTDKLLETPFRFASRGSALKCIDQLYMSFLGVSAGGLFYNDTLEKWVNIIGKEEFNLRLEKEFKKVGLDLGGVQFKLPGRTDREESFLNLKNDQSWEIVFVNKESGDLEEISLTPDPDMKKILRSYLKSSSLRLV